MSRIYEALKQSGETKPGSIVEMIDGAEAIPQRPARAEWTERTVSEYRQTALRLQPGSPLLPFDGSDPRAAEQYRMLRTNLLQHPTEAKIIAISSAGPGDGKTVTAINLAGSFALKDEARTIVVDADLRRGSIAPSLGIESRPGLADVLRGGCLLEDAIVSFAMMPNLHVLASGEVSGNPAELLDSPGCRAIMSELRARFSFVIVDTTPISAVADFKLIQQLSDGVVLVLRPDHSNRAMGLKAASLIPREKLLGTVINDFKEWAFWKNRDHYEYYSAGAGKNKPANK